MLSAFKAAGLVGESAGIRMMLKFGGRTLKGYMAISP